MSDGRKNSKASASSSSGSLRNTRAHANEENAQTAGVAQVTDATDLAVSASTAVDADTGAGLSADAEDAAPLDDPVTPAPIGGAEETAEDEESAAKAIEQPVINPEQEEGDKSEYSSDKLKLGRGTFRTRHRYEVHF